MGERLAAARGLGVGRGHVGEQLDVDTSVLAAAVGGGVGGDFLVLADPDEVETVSGYAVF